MSTKGYQWEGRDITLGPPHREKEERDQNGGREIEPEGMCDRKKEKRKQRS